MKKTALALCTAVFLLSANAFAQSSLSIEKIMQGEKFIGFSPTDVRWSPVGDRVYFQWNPDLEPLTSLYFASVSKPEPEKVTTREEKDLPSFRGTYNRNRTKMLYVKNGDIFILDIKTGSARQVTSTVENESNPVFSKNEDKVIYNCSDNLFSWDIATGEISQLTDLRQGKEKPNESKYDNPRDSFLHNNEMYLIRVLDERKNNRDLEEKREKALEPARPRVIYTGQGMARSLRISPDNNYLTWLTYHRGEYEGTIIPSYVTESGYTEVTNSRSKVGDDISTSAGLSIYDIKRDTVYQVKLDDIPGLTDRPDYLKDYPEKDNAASKKSDRSNKQEKRGVRLGDPVWSDDGSYSVVDIYANDNKDRWIMLLDIKTGGLKLLDRQHDDAWIAGPGIGYRASMGWLADNKTLYFQSEETGYSHIYTIDVTTGKKKAWTSGKYEVSGLSISNDKKTWYFISNEVDPGINELYKITVKDGKKTRLTNYEGGVEAELSPDEKYFALRMSKSNKPWELYIMENKENAVPVKVTESQTPEFRAYNWRVPEFVKIPASDGAQVPARLYQPATVTKNGPAVIFVHGAGYLQNAHRWWSEYYHEYMFHNFLVDNGYTVIDIDYRGSAGYGRNWRTAIYRYMGGRDLDDQVDGAHYLVDKCQVDPARIGIYGGSYGGFITLMAMFTKPGVFAAGAGLRSVTDWAHYNHGYTSDILNTPAADSIAYVRSSPIYYAEGLKGALLMCHGVIDDNVHFEDIVRLTQRLIELGKDNWELAIYPLERHGFMEPSSWTDEYKRIYKLFRTNLKKKD
ncbi:MAG TPA: prolyl oligopeptidase family serine peptidase [Bacteroidales bacterium]|nr:prolyl oligopeptidase family serine peptidase [Bacteroidales bacterium]